MELAQLSLVGFGGLFAVIGLVVLVTWYLHTDGRMRRLLGSPQRAARDVAHGERVMIRGIARPGPQGVVAASLTGQPALLHRASLIKRRKQNGPYEALYREGGQTEFWIEDESGATFVRTDDVLLLLERAYESRDDLAWLQARGYEVWSLVPRPAGKLPVTYKFIEQRIDPGQSVAAVGVVTLEPGPAGQPIPVLGSAGPTLLTNMTQRKAVKETTDGKVMGWVLIVLGTTAVAVGIALGMM